MRQKIDKEDRRTIKTINKLQKSADEIKYYKEFIISMR